MPESEYEVELFRKQGFTRQTCAKCGKAFWSLGHHETCGEAPCQEYDFIGNSPFKKKLTYRAMREDFLSFLEQNGHARVKRYPIVARWRDDVFFVQASVYPFQPWVISRQASPPANPLAISQPCVRFIDIDNVGKTGQHFTLFEMMAHHAFNFPDHPIYWKDHTVELCQLFLTERLGVDPTLVRYKEAWWEGGGNSGPCLEVVFGGAEAATLVFMQNRDVNGHRVPMDTTVVDTGYGLERLTWLSQGTTSAYEAVFGDALAYLKRATGAKRVDDKVLREYSKVAGMLKVEDLADGWCNKGDSRKLLKVEEAGYRETLEKGRATVGKIAEDLKAAGKGFDVDTLIQLYDSHGLNPDVVREFTDVPVEIPDDFYARVAARHDRPSAAEPAKKIDVSRDLPPTKLRVYEAKRKRSFGARVVAVEGEAVVLDQTYFYPEGGGQEADHGTIADHEVYDVQKVGPSILHFVRCDAAPLLKTRVACVIDAERREALMRNHTATHIVLGAARKVLGNHVWQAGAHKAPDLARLDITHYDALTEAEVARIEELANAEVLGHHQVRAKVMARDVAEKKFGFRSYQGGSVPGGELRVVEIPKWDVEACGGTHVSRTSDVSLIKILRSTRIQAGVVRLEYAAGKGALDAMRKQSDYLRRAADILSVPPDQVVSAAERLVAEWKELRKLSQRTTNEQATAKTREEIGTAKGAWPIVKDEVPQGVGFMMSMSKATASESRATGIYWAKAPNDVKLVVTRGRDVPIDAAELVRTVAPEFHGKGGGKEDFAEASFPNVDQARAAATKLEELIRTKLGIQSG